MISGLNCDKWAEIPLELLDQIVRFVDSYGDYIRLRSVCKNWKLELPKSPKYIKNPWLVLPVKDENETLRPFLNIEENKIYHMNLPETQQTVFRGAYYRWLISIGIDGALRVLNPFTRIQHDLPPLSTFPNVEAYDSTRVDDEYTLDDEHEFTASSHLMQKYYIRKIVISSPPDCDDKNFMAVAIYGKYKRLAYWRMGCKKWTDFSIISYKELIDYHKMGTNSDYEDAIFYKGKVYAVDKKARVYEFDMKTGVGGISEAPPTTNPNLYNSIKRHRYLVGTSDGLLMVIRHLKFFHWRFNCNGVEDSCYWTTGFEVYKLINKGDWLRLHSLGNQVILLGCNSSVMMGCDTFPDGKGNRIYFTDDNLDMHALDLMGGHDIGVFDMKDKSINRIFPRCDFIRPIPLWVLR